MLSAIADNAAGAGQEHRRGLGISAVAPSSLGSHLQVPRVQSSQGPGGGGPATTPVPRRGLCEPFPYPASWPQPKVTGQNWLESLSLAVAPASVPKSVLLLLDRTLLELL